MSNQMSLLESNEKLLTRSQSSVSPDSSGLICDPNEPYTCKLSHGAP